MYFDGYVSSHDIHPTLPNTEASKPRYAILRGLGQISKSFDWLTPSIPYLLVKPAMASMTRHIS